MVSQNVFFKTTYFLYLSKNQCNILNKDIDIIELQWFVFK